MYGIKLFLFFRNHIVPIFFAVCSIFACNEHVLAHGGVDDEAPSSRPVTTPNAMLTAVAFPDTAEIFVKYSAPKVGSVSTLKFFFSSFKTDVPFDPEKIEIELLGGKGEISKQLVKKENGIYEAAITFQSDTVYTIGLTYIIGGASIHANITPILVGIAALKALQKDEKGIPPSAASNNVVWWVISGMVFFAVALYFTIRWKKSKRR